MKWEDALPALELIDTVEEIERALADPEAFIQKAMAAAGPVAIKMLIAKLRPKLEPHLLHRDMKWEDALPALELLNNMEEITAAIDDPEGFIERAMRAAGPVAIKLLIAKLRPKLESVLMHHDIRWEDALPALELIDTMEEITAAIDDPEGFMHNLMNAAGPMAIKMLIAQLRPKLEPHLLRND